MLHEVSFQSWNKRDEVQGWIYVPACKPKGIVVLIHGFGEHSRRYFHLIVNLMEAGYIVAADDHVGHGKTAIVNNSWGDWGDGGFHTMMEDEHQLVQLVKTMYPDLPVYVYGHSMGSMIARDLAATYGDELAGVVLCGTTGTWPNGKEVEAMAKELVDAGKGKESDPNLTATAMGWMFARCESAKLGNEWICADPYVQMDHAKDPFDAFTKPTNNQSMWYFIQMITSIEGEQWAKKVPTDLKFLNIAGDQDPVGNFGQGVYQTSNWLIDTGHDVKTKLYPGYRHEIHNYRDLKNEVAADIIAFLDQL
ncbi:MAG: alpha/beta fold hydrolase [Erysipelotrichaceae bacterium]|nr:alpha/beta fold hydrolase [Erysipelotrichaceae bacterium]